MSSCVLCSSPNPKVMVDHGMMASLCDWLPQCNTACCSKKNELISTFFVTAGCVSLDCCSQNGQASFKWMRTNVFWPDHLIWSEYRLICTLKCGRSKRWLTIEDFIELPRRSVHHKISCNADLEDNLKACHITLNITMHHFIDRNSVWLVSSVLLLKGRAEKQQ